MLIVGLLTVAMLTAPSPTSTPLKEIGHVRASVPCAILRESVAPSVGAILRNDIAVEQAGVAFNHLVSAMNDGGADPGVGFAQVQILNWANRIEQNISEVNRRLEDPRFADNLHSGNLGPIRESLQRVVAQQEKLLNVLYSLAYSGSPDDLRAYPDPVQDEMRRVIRYTHTLQGGVFSAISKIAKENIGATRALENNAASRVAPMATSCGYTVPQPGEEPSPVTTIAPANSAGIAASVDSRPAKQFYDQLAANHVDRSRLTSAFSDRVTDSVLKTISAGLAALGPATWTYLGDGTIPGGAAQVYRLTYGGGLTAYYGFGSADGLVFGFAFSTQPIQLNTADPRAGHAPI